MKEVLQGLSMHELETPKRQRRKTGNALLNSAVVPVMIRIDFGTVPRRKNYREWRTRHLRTRCGASRRIQGY